MTTNNESAGGEPQKVFPLWKLILVWVARVLLGATFIFSGFTKAVDPWGTVYKLQEYFSVMHLSHFADVCVPLAFLLFTVEFMTGVYVITGCYRRLGVWLATAFMAVMLPLTLWIALKNPVSDCGCFGDAVTLSNWATFWKNVVLCVLVGWLLVYNRRARALVTPALQWIAFCLTVAFIVIVGWIGYLYQPLVDFRPYPLGVMLADNTADSEADVEMFGIYEKEGQRITLPLDSIPDESWTFVGREVPAENASDDKEEKESAVAIYDAEDDADVTSDVILTKGDQMLIFFNSLADVSTASFYRINSLYNYCSENGIDMIAIASGTPKQIEDFRDLSLAEFPIYLADESWIKEVVRGNPGVVMLHDGKIEWKSSLAALAPDDFMSPEAPDNPKDFARDNGLILSTLTWIYLSAMALLIVASFIPAVIRRLNSRKHNRFIKEASTAALMIAVVALSSCSSSENDDPVPVKKCQSTTLIYMVANNSLSQYSNKDIEEILEGCRDVDLDENKVLIFIASPTYNCGLYRVARSNSGLCALSLVKSYGDDLYSVDAGRVSEVVKDLSVYAPAEKYGLFFWSHATGWLPSGNRSTPSRAFGDDFGRHIDITELAGALPDGMMDYIWFDCCLMGGVECCYTMRDKARLIVCSPTELMSEGAPYNIILPMLATKDPDVVGAARSEYYYYSTTAASRSLGFTIAVVDCSKLPQLASAAHEIVAPSYPYISTTTLQTYGSHTIISYSGSKVRVTFYDLGQVFSRYCGERGADYSVFESVLDKTVIYKAATPKFGSITIDPQHFSGLSVYVPLSPDATGYNKWLTDFYYSLPWAEAIL